MIFMIMLSIPLSNDIYPQVKYRGFPEESPAWPPAAFTSLILLSL